MGGPEVFGVCVFVLSRVGIAIKIFCSFRPLLPQSFNRDNRLSRRFLGSLGYSMLKASIVPCLECVGTNEETENSTLPFLKS